MTFRFALRALAAFVVILSATASMFAQAAGGHFAVDDASILDVGQCQVETWVEDEIASPRSLLHIGPGCRVGPVELSVNTDYFHPGIAPAATVLGPQVKWATALDPRWSIGAVVAPGWQTRNGHYAGVTTYVPVSVRINDALLVHVNAGWDFLPGDVAAGRGGAAFEWRTAKRWVILGEEFHQSGANYARAGIRWEQSSVFSFDLSRARGIEGSKGDWWTFGVNFFFDRRATNGN